MVSCSNNSSRLLSNKLHGGMRHRRFYRTKLNIVLKRMTRNAFDLCGTYERDTAYARRREYNDIATNYI